MDNKEFINAFIKRLIKFSWAILLIALAFGGVFYFKAKKSVIKYISRATVFPLNSSNDNASPNSAISSILGISGDSKSFSSETSVGITELAISRRTSEAVASLKVKNLGNKNFAQLLIEENNLQSGFLRNQYIEMPKDSLDIINTGVSILKQGLVAKVSKTGILELAFKNTNPKLVRLISYAYIDKISEFYILLKKEKAQVDYNFAVKKADSLLACLNQIDGRLIKIDETTFFVDESLKRYSLPKLNLAKEKKLAQQQYFSAVSNRESAAYKLQKETPIIKILDNPEPPYDVEKKSTISSLALGLVIGTILGIILFNSKIIFVYIQRQIN